LNLKKNLSNSQKNARDEVAKLVMELENEKTKPPQIEIREKEIIKLEPKCANCSKINFQKKSIALQGLSFGALVYSILITIISIIRNKFIIADFKSFYNQVRGFLGQVVKIANSGFFELSNRVDNNILHWIIYIGLWLLVFGVIGYVSYKLMDLLRYKSWSFWNINARGILLLDLVVVAFLGEYIKELISVNLIWFSISVYGAYILIRVTKYIIRKNC
jgi:hypothetical protein